MIAGATGSGKTVCINTLIMSIIFKSDPKDVKMIMVDPKVVELSVYNGIPHLLIPVVTDPKKASGALNWAVAEMTDRYKKFAECNVRDLKGYNEKVDKLTDIPDDKKPKKLPQIAIIIDELADLMMVAPGEVEDSYLPSGTVSPCGRYPSGNCNPETICKCHHRSDQGQCTIQNCLCGFFRCRLPYHY